MFDQPTTFRCYLQTMGRARIRNSDYVVMLEDAKVDSFLQTRNNMHEINNELKKILITKAIDRVLTQEEIEREQVEAWEPLITEKNALVNSISSIALLNRFISRYANANLLWSRKDYGLDRVVAILQLPQNLKLPTHTITSDKFSDIKSAKQHAAFLACQILHEKGHLDAHLIPNVNHTDHTA
jgi:endoribonuclease Dicer